MSRQTADRFRQVAEAYGSKMLTVSSLPPTALYALASAEIDIRAEVEQMIAAGELVTKA